MESISSLLLVSVVFGGGDFFASPELIILSHCSMVTFPSPAQKPVPVNRKNKDKTTLAATRFLNFILNSFNAGRFP